MSIKNTFQLFSSMPGWEEVHTVIDRGVRRICREMIADIRNGTNISTALTHANQKCRHILRPYRDFGALDSEPVHHCEWLLIQALKANQYEMPANYRF